LSLLVAQAALLTVVVAVAVQVVIVALLPENLLAAVQRLNQS
jgi:hypothetical protein